MKKCRSIRFKTALWSTAVLVLTVGLSFLAVRFASGLVLRGINRNVLIDAVEKNVGMIRFNASRERPAANFYLEYGTGYLEIDEDFLNEMGGVTAALYDADGTLLYGEDPLARRAERQPFGETRIHRLRSGGETFVK